MTDATPPLLRTILARSLRRRCPRCGRGRLFGRWLRLRPSCTACGLTYEEQPGDLWAFWLLIERLFLGLILLVIVLGFRSRTWAVGLSFGSVSLALFALTMPHRLGLCVGLDFFLRRWTGAPPTPVDSTER